MSGNFAIKGGGVGPLMANAILNFHFDFPHPSLTEYRYIKSGLNCNVKHGIYLHTRLSCFC